jgi:hypothetical protein
MKPTLIKEGIFRALWILVAIIILIISFFIGRFLYNLIKIQSQPSAKYIQSQTIKFDLQGWDKVKGKLE